MSDGVSSLGRHISQSEHLEWLQLVLVLLFPVAAVLFGMDIFEVNTPIARLVPADIIAMALIASVVSTRRSLSLSPLSWALIATLAVFGLVGLSTLAYLNLADIAVSNGRALSDIVRYPLYATTILCSVSVLRARQARGRYLQVLVALVALTTIIGLAQLLATLDIPVFEQWFMWANIRGGGDRIASTFRWQGPLVLWFGVFLPVVAALAVMETSRVRYWAYLILFAGGVLATLSSGSRSGLLVLPLACAPFLAGVKDIRSGWHQAATVVGLGVVAVGALVFVQIGALVRLFTEFSSALTNPTEINRVLNWSTGLSGWWDTSRFFGVGPRHYIGYSTDSAHNSYIAALVERGVLGALTILIYVSILLKMAVGIVTDRTTERWPLQVALAAGVVNYLGYMMLAEGLTYRASYPYLIFVIAVYEGVTTQRWTFDIQDIGRMVHNCAR